jgi:hypothetical protein
MKLAVVGQKTIKIHGAAVGSMGSIDQFGKFLISAGSERTLAPH